MMNLSKGIAGGAAALTLAGGLGLAGASAASAAPTHASAPADEQAPECIQTVVKDWDKDVTVTNKCDKAMHIKIKVIGNDTGCNLLWNGQSRHWFLARGFYAETDLC